LARTPVAVRAQQRLSAKRCVDVETEGRYGHTPADGKKSATVES